MGCVFTPLRKAQPHSFVSAVFSPIPAECARGRPRKRSGEWAGDVGGSGSKEKSQKKNPRRLPRAFFWARRTKLQLQTSRNQSRPQALNDDPNLFLFSNFIYQIIHQCISFYMVNIRHRISIMIHCIKIVIGRYWSRNDP